MTALLGSEKPLNGKRNPLILMAKNYDVFHPNLITSKQPQIKYQSRHEDELICVIKDTRILKVCQLLQKKNLLGFWSRLYQIYRSTSTQEEWYGRTAWALVGLGQPVPSGPRWSPPAGHCPVTPEVQCAPPRGGTGVRCGEPFLLGHGARPERQPPPRHHALLLCGEPGSKLLVDDLLFGPSFMQLQSSSLAAI